MCSYLKKYVTIMSYLTGVSDELLIRIYSKDNNDLLIELRGNTSATLIRTLSIMRTQAIKHYRAFSPSLISFPKHHHTL